MLPIVQTSLPRSTFAQNILRKGACGLFHSQNANSTATMSNGVVNAVELAKERAAVACIDENVSSGQIIGVGSGSTALYSIQRLAEIYHSGKIENIKCVPTSYDSRHLLIKQNLPVTDLDQFPCIDVYIDGADEIDHRLNCIKGGGGCLTEEKIVMSCSKKFFLIADFRKKSKQLGQSWKYIPIEVCRSAYVPVSRRIEATDGGSCQLRSGSGKAGPVVTDNGNFILDWHFSTKNGLHLENQWNLLNTQIAMIPGVVETGLFMDVADKAYFGMEDGSVVQVEAPRDRQEFFKKASFH